MVARPPARCPGCDQPVKLTLASDPDTPVYACGSTPTRIVCEQIPLAFAIDNIELPTAYELLELVELGIASATSQYLRVTAPPAIGLCGWIGCSSTALDGWCLEHEGAAAGYDAATS